MGEVSQLILSPIVASGCQGRLFVLERPENVLGPTGRAKSFGKLSVNQNIRCSGDNITGKVTAASLLVKKKGQNVSSEITEYLQNSGKTLLNA